MPSDLHPQAKFDPIPPDLDLSALVEKTPNFDYVVRISTQQILELGLPEFEKLVLLHVIIGGKPLVVEGWKSSLPPWLFSTAWLEDNVGKKQENVRDIGNNTDMPMTIGHYLNSMEKLTKQWTPLNFRDPKRQRLYLKDIDCPDAWHQHLENIIPQSLYYLNDCVGEKGGPGAMHEHNQYGQSVLGKGIAPAGDLMSSLPPEMRAQNMMCYIGHEGTYTPAHREMCASLGQNIMVEAADSRNGERDGSSIWFMTESKDREVVSEYFLSMLGHDIEIESHFAQINAWKKAPFPVYIVEQKVGDFILIPPLAPHQVWNRGSRTMKVAWNRTTVETLELALHEALPRARMVCRDEQYKNKAIIYHSLLRYHERLQLLDQAEEANYYAGESIRYAPRVKQLQRDFKRLFALYTEVLVSEMFSSELPQEKNVEFVPFDSNITCSYCRCNIFNRFLTCKTCIGVIEATGEEDTYDVCMECYAMGRSCGCISNLTWVEQWHWSDLTQRYEDWRAMVISIDGYIDAESSPQPLEIARKRFGKKSVAQVCQEQLKLRPWQDIANPAPKEPPDSENEPEVDDEGRLKKKKMSKRRSNHLKKSHKACHICKRHEWLWKLALCTTCPNAYCYGSLWRAFDLKPQSVMENPDWQCPKCLNMCSCGKCRKIAAQDPYRPKGTLLGHDTRRVADPRSVESLVDFSRTNLAWLKADGDENPQNSQRMQNLIGKAQAEKARDETLEEDLAAHDESTLLNYDTPSRLLDVPHQGADMAIDPQLSNGGFTAVNGEGTSGASLHEVGEQFGANSAIHDDHIPVQNGMHPDLPDSGFHTINEPHQTNEFSHAGFVAPAAIMLNPDESSYPDPAALGRDRMMGMGYYQQSNDADKILFDHPDASGIFMPSTNPNTNIEYPRLASEVEPPRPNSKKRRREAGRPGDGVVDETHEQFLHAQKKQKLAEARKQGKFYMVQNQLEGGRSLTVKLPMMTQKEFLRRLDDLDRGRSSKRYNPRPSRVSMRSQIVDLDSGGEEIHAVKSDVAKSTPRTGFRSKKSVPRAEEEDQSLSESQESSEGYMEGRSHKITHSAQRRKGPVGNAKTIASTKRSRSGTGRKPSSSKVPSQDLDPARSSDREPMKEISSEVEGVPSNITEPVRKRQRTASISVTATDSRVDGPGIGVEISSMDGAGDVENFDRGKDHLEVKSLETPKNLNQSEDVSSASHPPETQVVELDQAPTSLPNEATTVEDTPMLDEDPVMEPAEVISHQRSPSDSASPTPTSTTMSKLKNPLKRVISPTVSDDYQNAKLMALRIAEGESEEELSPIPSPSPAKPPAIVKPTTSSTSVKRRGRPPGSGKVPPKSVRGRPSMSRLAAASTEGKMLSMAERLALQGRKIKIVSVKSKLAGSSPINGNHNKASERKTATLTPKSAPIVRIQSISRGNEDSSSDDDEEIPAVRPGGPKDVKRGVGRPVSGRW